MDSLCSVTWSIKVFLVSLIYQNMWDGTRVITINTFSVTLKNNELLSVHYYNRQIFMVLEETVLRNWNWTRQANMRNEKEVLIMYI